MRQFGGCRSADAVVASGDEGCFVPGYKFYFVSLKELTI